MAGRNRSTPLKSGSVRKSKVKKTVPPEKPVLFISHRHSDERIATVFHKLLEDWGEKRLDIVQTSYGGSGLPIGENVNQALLDGLQRASVLLLLYTRPDEDWSYCMWEAGAAVDPQYPGNTRISVAYCMGKPPKVFGSNVMVDARNLSHLENFTNQYLTDPDFFPGYGKPLSKHGAGGDVVKSRAKALYGELKKVLPPIDEKPPSNWPAWPWIRFELSLDQISTITELPKEQGCRQIGESARIVEHDKNAARLLKKVSLDEIPTLGKLVDTWRAKLSANGDEVDRDWCHSLCGQIFDAASDSYPLPEWKQLCDVDRRGWFLPMLMHVHTWPARGCKHFDVYFPRIHVESGGEYTVTLPNEPETL